MVQAAVVKTVRQLTSEPKVSEETDIILDDLSIFGRSEFKPIGYEWEEESGMLPSKIRITRALIENELIRSTKEIFGKKKFTYKDIVEPSFPSTKANFEYSRGAGGQVGSLQKYWEELRVTNLVSFREIPVTLRHRMADFRSSKTKEEQDRLDDDWAKYLWEWSSEEQQVKESIGATIDTTNIVDLYKKLYWKVWPDAVDEAPCVRAVGLPEPFKVRVISKGPALKYFCLKPLQKWLWRNLKNNPVFELIGKPDDENLINHLFGNLAFEDIIVSGDYKASTDNLHSWVSETICGALMPLIRENFPPEELELLPLNFFEDLSEMVRDCLTGHIFQNSSADSSDFPELLPNLRDEDGKVPKWLPQKEGQLMGSIISFPFLCIANAALCRHAMEISNHREYRLDGNIPLRVNGDDCIFSGNRSRIRSVWEKVTAFGGLESSVGKTYFSSEFCVIDSKLYDKELMGGDNQRYIWSERKFVNCGLLYGQSKSGFKRGKTLANIGCVHRELLRTCPEICIEEADASFLRIHRELLDSTCGLAKWFLPEWLGGLGLSPRYHPVSSQDCALSFYMRKKLSNGEKPVKQLKTPDEWRLHRLVNDRYLSQVSWLGEAHYQDICSEELTCNIEEEYSKIYKLLTIALLFDKDVEVDDLQECIGEEERAFKEKANFRLAERNCAAYGKLSMEIYNRDENRLIDPLDLVHFRFNRYLPLISKKPKM